jgi:NAD/NADP transhydrogenase beta subunit
MKSYSARGDQLDIDHLRQTVEHPGYGLIEAKLRMMLDDMRAKLESEREDVRYVQGQIATMRRVMELPVIIEKEIRQKVKTRGD